MRSTRLTTAEVVKSRVATDATSWKSRTEAADASSLPEEEACIWPSSPASSATRITRRARRALNQRKSKLEPRSEPREARAREEREDAAAAAAAAPAAPPPPPPRKSSTSGGNTARASRMFQNEQIILTFDSARWRERGESTRERGWGGGWRNERREKEKLKNDGAEKNKE